MGEENDLQENGVIQGEQDPLGEAGIHLEEGRPAEAVQLLEALIENEPDNALAHQELAQAYLRTVRYVQAEKAARWALDLDPSLHRPHGVLARVALKKRRFHEAEAELEEQLQALPPQDVEMRAAIRNMTAAIYFRQRRYDEAEEALGQALALQPDRAVLRFNRAMLFLRTRQYEETAAELERLLALSEVPADIAHPAHFNLGHLYARQGRYRDARAQFAQALEVKPTILGTLFRAVPFLARFQLATLLVIVVIIALLIWLILTRI